MQRSTACLEWNRRWWAVGSFPGLQPRMRCCGREAQPKGPKSESYAHPFTIEMRINATSARDRRCT